MRKYSLSLVLPIVKSDSNKILGRNAHVKHRIFKEIKDEIANLALLTKPKKPLESFKISVSRHSTRELDYDNFIASLKPYIDGLTLSGIIKDDSWKYIKHINVDQIRDKDRKIIITVEEV